ncbi:trigger factor [Candidatus Saccharibacteria bacterium]|nr:trigger factor [Candidatus Saccharibacteria bacterium]MBR3332104.1 trigger factor [Candidatus Saccharibacteria bacterium]
MKTKSKKLSDSRVEITVTLDSKDLKSAAEKALEKLAKEIKVEGFRQGKVPAEVAKKFIPENDLNAETIDVAVRTTVIEAFKENEKSPLVMPSVNVTKYVPGEMAEYTATADIIPEIKLGDYKKLGVKREEAKISEKDVKGVLDNLASSFAEKKVVKRAAKLGDEVIIDFVGKKDGKAFDGGSAKDYHLTLGSNTFIPGFEDGIVGHESGDKFDLELTFPKDYGVKDLAGAKTVFEVLVKQVNEITKPAIDDEMAKKCGPFKTLQDLKDDIKKNLAAQSEQRLENKYKDDLVNALVAKSKVPAPEILIKDQLNMIREDISRNAATQGMSFEDYLKRAGETEENWEKQARKIAEARVKASLALQTLAVNEKITVSDDLVAAKIAELKDVYKKSPEALKSLKDPNVKMDIKNRMIIEATLDFLVKNNK